MGNILVTGAGKGIGRQILLDGIEKKSTFIYAIIRSKKDFIYLKKKIPNKNCKLYLGDTKNLKLIEKIINDSKKLKKEITGLVNNSGERQRVNFINIDHKKLNHIFQNNYFNHFFLIQKIINTNKSKNKLSVVNIGSIVGQLGFDQLSGYASTKSALDGLTKSLAVEFAKYKIRFNIIHPGFIKTSYYKNFKKKKPKLYKWTLSRIPLKKWGEPKDVSSLAFFLLSDKSNYITGQSIYVDGGWTSS